MRYKQDQVLTIRVSRHPLIKGKGMNIRRNKKRGIRRKGIQNTSVGGGTRKRARKSGET